MPYFFLPSPQWFAGIAKMHYQNYYDQGRSWALSCRCLGCLCLILDLCMEKMKFNFLAAVSIDLLIDVSFWIKHYMCTKSTIVSPSSLMLCIIPYSFLTFDWQTFVKWFYLPHPMHNCCQLFDPGLPCWYLPQPLNVLWWGLCSSHIVVIIVGSNSTGTHVHCLGPFLSAISWHPWCHYIHDTW